MPSLAYPRPALGCHCQALTLGRSQLRTRGALASATPPPRQLGLTVRAAARRLHGSSRRLLSTGKKPPAAEAAEAEAAALPTPGLAAVLSPTEFHTFVKRYGPVALGAKHRLIRVRFAP